MTELSRLVLDAQRGRAEAYQQLVRRFQDMAHGYACSILGDVHLAEDAVQEAFVEAYERLRMLRHPLAFPAWLKRLVFKHCDRQTRRKRIKAVVYADAEATTLEWEPSRAAERRDLSRHVMRAMQALPENQRELASMFYLKGCSQQDISSFLGVPVSTIKKRLQLARRNLRDRMLAAAEEALSENYLDDKFATHLVAGLLSRPRLLNMEGHPVRQVWDAMQQALDDYEVVESNDVEHVETGWLRDEGSLGCAIHIDPQRVLRRQLIGNLWGSLRGRTSPIRLLTASRSFRDRSGAGRSMNVTHQVEGVCIDAPADERQLRQTIVHLLKRAVQSDDVRLQRVPAETLDCAHRVAVGGDRGVFCVGVVGILKRRMLDDAGFDSGSNSGIAFALELEPLAMEKFGVADVRDLWGPKYCPVVDNFDQADLQSLLQGSQLSGGAEAATPVKGFIPGDGRVTPGRTWMTPD
ncbi:MAG: sigma-70 family RNA polymerase sigma factor, partial [Planctomycetota bacterium]